MTWMRLARTLRKAFAVGGSLSSPKDSIIVYATALICQGQSTPVFTTLATIKGLGSF